MRKIAGVFFGILYEGMNKHTYLLLSTVSRDLPEDSREKKKLSRLQVNPHFIMAAQPVRGRLKNMFWAGSWINYIKGEISLPLRLILDYLMLIQIPLGWGWRVQGGTCCPGGSHIMHFLDEDNVIHVDRSNLVCTLLLPLYVLGCKNAISHIWTNIFLQSLIRPSLSKVPVGIKVWSLIQTCLISR